MSKRSAALISLVIICTNIFAYNLPLNYKNKDWRLAILNAQGTYNIYGNFSNEKLWEFVNKKIDLTITKGDFMDMNS